MNSKFVNDNVDFGIAINIAAGHIGEMLGKSVQAVAKVTNCPIIQLAGRIIEDASRAWSDAAVTIGNRDRRRLTDDDDKVSTAEIRGTP